MGNDCEEAFAFHLTIPSDLASPLSPLPTSLSSPPTTPLVSPGTAPAFESDMRLKQQSEFACSLFNSLTSAALFHETPHLPVIVECMEDHRTDRLRIVRERKEIVLLLREVLFQFLLPESLD